MSNGSVKSVNRGPISGFLFKDGASLFQPRTWMTSSNFNSDIVRYSPSTQGQMGGSSTWNILQNTANYFGKVVLEFNLDPATVAAAAVGSPDAGTPERYDNFVTYSALRRLRVRYGTNEVEDLTGEDLKFKFYDERYDEYKRQELADQLHGPDLPAADRRANVTNGITCRCELPFWFTRALTQYKPQVLGAQVSFIVEWANLGDIMQNSVGYSGSVNISNQALYIEQIYCSVDEAAALQLGAQKGLMYLMDNIQTDTIQPSALSAGTQNINHELRTFNQDTTYLKIIPRTNDQLSTAFDIDRWTVKGEDPGADNYEILTVGLQQAGSSIIRTAVPRSIYKPFAYSWTRSGPGIQDNTIEMDFSRHPLSSTDAFGSLNFGGFNVPTVVYQIRSTGGGELPNIKVMATTKKVLHIKGGNMWTAF